VNDTDRLHFDDVVDCALERVVDVLLSDVVPVTVDVMQLSKTKVGV
jgi:hypothetical protein